MGQKQPFLPKLHFPTIFAHRLHTDDEGMLAGYTLRVGDGKRNAVRSFRGLGFRTMAVGDSYNDITMLQEAEHAVLYRPPANVVADYPNLPATWDYAALGAEVSAFVMGGRPGSGPRVEAALPRHTGTDLTERPLQGE